MRIRTRGQGQELAMLLPALIFITALIVVPFLLSVWFSFTDQRLVPRPIPTKFIGTTNYERMFVDPLFWQAILNTVLFALIVTPVQLAMSLGAALILNSAIPFRGFFRTALFLPFIVSLAVAAFAWSYLLDPRLGLLNYWLQGAGVQLGDVLEDPVLAMPAVAMVAVWKNFGFYMVIFLAGLQDIPASLYEAARVDGAGAWRRFTNVTLPLLSNTFAFVLIFALIAALQAFDQIYVMTGGGPYGHTQTIVMEIYQSGFRKLDLGFASALSYVLLIATLLLSIVQFVFFGRREKDLA